MKARSAFCNLRERQPTICVKGILLTNAVLQFDSAFVNVVQIVDNVNGNLEDDSMISKVKDNCIQFLLKYSNMIPSVHCKQLIRSS